MQIEWAKLAEVGGNVKKGNSYILTLMREFNVGVEVEWGGGILFAELHTILTINIKLYSRVYF